MHNQRKLRAKESLFGSPAKHGGGMSSSQRPSSPPPHSDQLAAIEWSIALTSRLLIKHRAGLHLRRPQVERRLRRVMALWLCPAVYTSFWWLRKHTRELRRASLASAMQARNYLRPTFGAQPH